MTVESRYINIGTDLARKFFDKRSKSGSRNVEVHLDETALAALLALAAEQGAGRARSVNQCDGCRAGKPLTKLVDGKFVEAKDGTLHVMGSTTPGCYTDLMGCTRHLYEEEP